MRIRIGDSGDTLLRIAERYRVDLIELAALNPHIVCTDANLVGSIINIPHSLTESETRIVPPTPMCPPFEVPDFNETWIPVTSLEQMEKTDYDVLIVGSGAGGGASLWRLCQQWAANGKRIGIVERGKDLLPLNAQNVLEGDLFRKYLFNPNIAKPLGKTQPEYSGLKQVFALGGRTIFWSGVSPRMHPSDFATWPVTLKEMDYYYAIAEQMMNVTQDFSRNSKLTEVIVKRLQDNGFPEATTIPNAFDLMPTMYGEIHSNVIFSSIKLLFNALYYKPYDLAINARAVQVYSEKGKVAGVRVMSPDKRSYYLKAKTIILSASTIETARLLLHSGIQGRAIGRYLINHTLVGANGKINIKPIPEISGTLAAFIPRIEGRPYQIQIQGPSEYYLYPPHQPKPNKDEWDVGYTGFGEVESRYENGISLDPQHKDEYGVPMIKINFSYSDKDMEIVQNLSAAIRETALAAGIRLNYKDDGSWSCLLEPGVENHEAGTCRMGNNPNDAATNEYGQVFGVAGLYVADNSVLPTIGATNPTLTTVALAIRTADYIAREMR